jgi:hypothetical protein
MRFIEVSEIKAGDTITWSTSNPNPNLVLNYMVVEDVLEGETNPVSYGLYGEAIDSEFEYPSVVLRGKVMCSAGERADKVYKKLNTELGGYALFVGGPKVILISRKGEQ